MAISKLQFRWCAANGVASATTALYDRIPFTILKESGETTFLYSVIASGAKGFPKSSQCDTDGQRDYCACIEGVIERSVLCHMVTGDDLHNQLDDDCTNKFLTDGIGISVGIMGGPNTRKLVMKRPRQFNRSIFQWYAASMSRFLGVLPREFQYPNRVIFAPSFSAATWNGNVFTEIQDANKAETLMTEVSNENQFVSVDGFKAFYEAQDQYTTKHYTTNQLYGYYEEGNSHEIQTYNDLLDFINKKVGMSQKNWLVKYQPSDSGESYWVTGSGIYDALDCTVFGGTDTSIVSYCATNYNNYCLYPQYIDAPIRLTGFIWGAANACLERVGAWGAQGFNATYEDEAGYAHDRAVYPMKTLTREVMVDIWWNETDACFEGGYSNAKVFWDECSVWRSNVLQMGYNESTNEGASGDISWHKVFDAGFFGANFVPSGEFDWLIQNGTPINMNAKIPIDDPEHAGEQQANYGVMHLTAAQLLAAIEGIESFAGEFTEDSGGGGIHAEKSMSATLPEPDAVEETDCDAWGLDDFPCSYAVTHDYVKNNSAFLWGIGVGKIWDTSEWQYNNPVASFVNVFGSESFSVAGANRQINLRKAMSQVVAKFVPDCEKARQRLLLVNRIAGKQTIENWFNGFEFGNGDIASMIAQAEDSWSQGNYEETSPYYDLYFLCNADNEPISLIAFAETWQANWVDSDDYRWQTFPQSKRKGAFGSWVEGYAYLQKYVYVNIEPNRTKIYEDWKVRASITGWLQAHDWDWRAYTAHRSS